MVTCNSFCKLAEVPVLFLSLTFMLSNCSSEYKKFEGNQAKQVAAIIKDNGCLMCHSTQAAAPFYASFPVVGDQVKKDMKEGTHYVDLTAMVKLLENGGKVSETDLTKVEYAVLGESMPPTKFSAVHWGSSLSSAEKKIVLDWAKATRAANYLSPAVAEQFKNEPVQPLMASIPTDSNKVKLGFKLYHDTRLSADNTVSCATCHGLNTGGVDRKQFSEGIKGQLGGVNAPTVYNAALNFVQFWDGRAADLKEQAAGPPLNPVEMGHKSFDDISAGLLSDSALKEEFEAIYPEGITQSTITDAIAEFEKTLLTPSRFDEYLRGNADALSKEEIEGYELFKENNCATCHVGMNLGGQSFEYMGVKESYFDFRGTGLTDGDNGRFSVTKDENDRHKFKTPTLRNVAVTYPYMHDGTVTSLKDAIRYMHTFQVGKGINDQDMQKLVAFLNTLTGTYQGQLLK
ncbi:cytochrome c peroxidase [Parabacteroides pacaensis]|uniref:cytochrome c peroxidase n=1 Tax=Parabacteroides pacaensis TaxID=2086575 RepID=UPI000D101CB5|nr:cytochrome c peroxidase [Parabacteroides pacaensis]